MARPGPRPDYGPDNYAAFLKDPDGYRIEPIAARLVNSILAEIDLLRPAAMTNASHGRIGPFIRNRRAKFADPMPES